MKKTSGGFRLVTAFAEIGRYSKPQPSLMPDVDSTLRSSARWKYLITSDLSSAFCQIPLSKSSIKYRTAALESIHDARWDCGGNTLDELLSNWKRVLDALQKSNLKLSPSKTVTCPRSTTILGWIWTQGALSATPDRAAVLAKCPPPDTVRGLRSFIGAYKVLSRVLPNCSAHTSPLGSAIAGYQSQDKIVWTDDLYQKFYSAQKALSTHKSITLPRADDHLWIVTDGSVTRQGICATMYVSVKTNTYFRASSVPSLGSTKLLGSHVR